MYRLRCVILFTCFLFFEGSLSAQEQDSIAEKAEPAAVNTNSTNYTDSAAALKFKTIDGYILKLKKKNKAVPILAKYITATCTSDEEKIRALFIWMTNNIAFDCLSYHNKKTPSGNLSHKTQEELQEKLDKYYYNYSMLVLRNKRGVAEGYAILFRELCKNAGITCQLVEGRASENKEKIKKLRNRKSFSTNHTWNKVLLNEQWYYVDVTWASGYCDKQVRRFYKKFNPCFAIYIHHKYQSGCK